MANYHNALFWTIGADYIQFLHLLFTAKGVLRHVVWAHRSLPSSGSNRTAALCRDELCESCICLVHTTGSHSQFSKCGICGGRRKRTLVRTKVARKSASCIPIPLEVKARIKEEAKNLSHLPVSSISRVAPAWLALGHPPSLVQRMCR